MVLTGDMALPTKIMVPTDFSDTAAAALDYALELAAKVGASVHVVHFYSYPIAPFEAPYPFAFAELNKNLETEALKALANLTQTHKREGVQVSTATRLGDARSGVLESVDAVGADMICMGTHGRRGLSHLLLGSVAEYTVRLSKVPVLTVHPAT